MQPEPIEASSQSSSQSTVSETSFTSQYGPYDSSADSRDEYDFISEYSRSSSPAGGASSTSRRGSRDTLQDRSRRLNSGDNGENRVKPSFQRINEYENALSPTPPRKRSEGLGFRVVQSKSSRSDGPKLDEFPNGISISTLAVKYRILT